MDDFHEFAGRVDCPVVDEMVTAPGSITKIYVPTQPGWFVDPIPGSPTTRARYFDGAVWTERTYDATQPRPQQLPPVEVTRGLGSGLRAGSGCAVGLIGGMVGEAAAIALVAVAHALRWTDHGRISFAYLVLLAAVWGAVLAAALLSTNAAMIDRRTQTQWLVRGLLLGGAIGTVGLVSARLVWAGASDGDGRIVIAIMLFYGSMGLSIGLAAGLARGGATLWTGLAGATAGAIAGLVCGPAFIIANPIIAGAIGAAVGAIRPRRRPANFKMRCPNAGSC